MRHKTPEHLRLEEAREGTKWRRWGTYLSERQWGSVREDYSANGDAWSYLPFDKAHLRAYRWGEDGLLGLSDNRGLMNFAVALWNGKDPILKERLFGLSNPEGNHGEDVKEVYYYLDATPTHSYARALYKYPHREFPYEELRERARRAGRQDPEPELMDTGVFDGDAYFDVFVEYGKASTEDVLVKLTIVNRGPDAELLVLPQLWFRNTWSWGDAAAKPNLYRGGKDFVVTEQEHLGRRLCYAEGAEQILFTENETHKKAAFGVEDEQPYVKDAFHRWVVNGDKEAVSPREEGTKCAFVYKLSLRAGESRTLRLRLRDELSEKPFADFDEQLALRIREADAFWAAIMPEKLGDEERRVFRQAAAGLLWSKQFYHYDVERWLRGDPKSPPPPGERRSGKNAEWTHLFNSEVLSMPDKWEYPWYAAWDLAFHSIPIALFDAEFAKQQLSLLTREWYMHPNGQLPAYEWAFGDVNPPVHAWAAERVYQIERRMTGRSDRAFLESVFHKLMLNFTWWVNRKDAHGRNVFQGGFLGLDNIGVFDRSMPLPGGHVLEQADATSWMGMYCLNLLEIALELARENNSYEDVANKFFEHFLLIAKAANLGDDGKAGLWDEKDGFFYDCISAPTGERTPLKVRSMVGLIPLCAVTTLDGDVFDRFPAFAKRVGWFLQNRPELAEGIASIHDKGSGQRRLLSLLDRRRLVRVLSRMLDETEFLSPYGLRGLSRAHAEKPFVFAADGKTYRVDYEPGESQTGMFGGNSNWRGPVWFPVNYLIIEALQKYHHFYGDSLRVECPRGSGQWMNLWEVGVELSRRLVRLFQRDAGGRRPAHGATPRLQSDPNFADYVLFYEYFHGDTGAGLGAAHQTGWTALVVKLLQQSPFWEAKWDEKRARMVLP
ncbi:MAG TPA: glucosidase [Polyangiaceae bacterium]|nr:glucosidase [Polyangiaceae bacterium]